MPDITDVSQSTIEKWRSLNSELQSAERNLQAIKRVGPNEEIRQAQEKFRNAGEELKKYIDKLSETEKQALKTSVSQIDLSNSSKTLAKSSGLAGESLNKLSEHGKKAAELLGLAGSASLLLGTNLGRSLVDPTQDATEAFKNLSSNSLSLFDRFRFGGKVVKTFIQTLSAGNEIIKNYRRVLSDVNDAHLKFGQSIGRGHDQTIDYLKTVEDLSAGLGFQASVIRKVAKDAADVPHAFDQLATSSVSAARKSEDLAGLMLVMRGAALNAADAGTLLNERYLKFGERTAEVVSQQLAKSASAAEDMGVSIRVAKDQITNASEPLAIFGRKSSEATRTWKTFVQALGDQIPIQQVSRLLSSLTGQIAGMSLENRAFLSMISGFGRGMGALAGGLRMELMLRREGGLEQNINALADAVSQIGGGQIITLEQAAETPGLANLFEVQRRLLGQMIGVQGQDADRMLQVLQQIKEGGMSQVEASKAIKDLTRRGETAQKEEMTAQERLAQNMKRTANLTEELVNIERSTRRHIEQISEYMTRGAGGRSPLGQPEVMQNVGKSLKNAATDVISAGMKASRKIADVLGSIEAGRRKTKRPDEIRTTGAIIEGNQQQQIEATPIENDKIIPDINQIINLPSSAINRITAPVNRQENFRRDQTALNSISPTAQMQNNNENIRVRTLGPVEEENFGTVKVAVVCEQCNGKIKEQLHKIQQHSLGINT